uniref:Orf1 n=1 Tax=Methylorubrum extorquens TaxID=408 RepID=P71504_METEX|nr:orf1 [Methylorubrum extorquens AM1]
MAGFARPFSFGMLGRQARSFRSISSRTASGATSWLSSPTSGSATVSMPIRSVIADTIATSFVTSCSARRLMWRSRSAPLVGRCGHAVLG